MEQRGGRGRGAVRASKGRGRGTSERGATDGIGRAHRQEASSQAQQKRLDEGYARAARACAKLSHDRWRADEPSAHDTGGLRVPVTPSIDTLNDDTLKLITDTQTASANFALANVSIGLRSSMRAVIQPANVVLGVLHQHDESAFARDRAGLKCSGTAVAKWIGARCELGVLDGVGYFEAQQLSSWTIQSGSPRHGGVHTRPGILRVGWLAKIARQRGMLSKTTYELGMDAFGFGYGGTGKKSTGGQFTDYGGEFGDGDIIGCTLDRVNRTISFSKNGAWLGVAFEVTSGLQDTMLHPAICLKGCTVQLNLGATPFKFPPPRGYRAPYPLSSHRSEGTVSSWDVARGVGTISMLSSTLFCHHSNIVDGNALQPGAHASFVIVVDQAKHHTRRAEQITGSVTQDREDTAVSSRTRSIEDNQLIARQQAEIEALRLQLQALGHAH